MKKIITIVIAGIMVLGCTKMAPELSSGDPGQINCTPQFPDKQVTYKNYVKGIVSRYCTESCHRGGNTLGPGNFTTYAGLRPYIEEVNTFYYRVIQDNADMPQGNAPLPKAIRDSLNIWIKNCGPEN